MHALFNALYNIVVAAVALSAVLVMGGWVGGAQQRDAQAGGGAVGAEQEEVRSDYSIIYCFLFVFGGMCDLSGDSHCTKLDDTPLSSYILRGVCFLFLFLKFDIDLRHLRCIVNWRVTDTKWRGTRFAYTCPCCRAEFQT
jgi:hypothetical protein